jgi:hypothetical protein
MTSVDHVGNALYPADPCQRFGRSHATGAIDLPLIRQPLDAPLDRSKILEAHAAHLSRCQRL